MSSIITSFNFLLLSASKNYPQIVNLRRGRTRRFLSSDFLPFIISKVVSHAIFSCYSIFFSFRTTLCLQYLPICIADSALFLVTIQMGLIPVNTDKTWIQLIDSELEIEVVKGSNCIHIFYYFFLFFYLLFSKSC